MTWLPNSSAALLSVSHGGDGGSSLAVSAVTHGHVVMLSLSRLPAGMPHQSRRKRFLWRNQCHLHMQAETNPHRREVLHLRPLFFVVFMEALSYSMIPWQCSPQRREQSMPSHPVQREGIWEKVCPQNDSVQRIEAKNRLCGIEWRVGGWRAEWQSYIVCLHQE